MHREVGRAKELSAPLYNVTSKAGQRLSVSHATTGFSFQ